MQRNETDWISGRAVSERFGIPESTLAQWRYLGRGPRYAKFGKHVRYRPADIERWEADQLVEPGAPST